MSAPVRAESRYAVGTRVLHWVAATLVFATLLVGFVLANSLADYGVLLSLHKALGTLVFVVFVVRVINRLTDRGPALPATVGQAERVAVIGSELGMYVLLLMQPLLGWAMLSASGVPVALGDTLRLPPIAPLDAGLFGLLRNCHSVVAYALVVLIAAHVSAVLLHTLTLRDGMLRRMTFGKR
ncbi:cytochrome b [Mycobacterium sp. TNTM28]|uniref:Cytochrome b n=1 Tax=[Mycobacterium] fortunisiensis TaxID=2600579 RepID=A0ABS6KTE7_9MYCO|nr:cytochrome b/b6 domain-containing protein [[Mycobacterium] fortunisiensis]MBU9766718.1 cytochrome b [[Mycobacterium] fortunisiensis]